jgi:hypothetical protein
VSIKVACGSGKQVVWTAPAVTNNPGPCTVTVLFKGSAQCHASLWAADALGNNKGLRITGEQPYFVTFHDIAQLSLDCWSSGPGGGDGCTLDIVQLDCAR